MRPEKGFADVNGTRLHYEIGGAGEPLVLIHGFSLDTRVWEPQREAFARDHRVIRYDLRGFGRSALPDGTPYPHHEDLKALLDRLGDRVRGGAGHSMEAPAQFNAAVLAFWRGRSPAEGPVRASAAPAIAVPCAGATVSRAAVY